jgi:DNA-binding response OmpR family regulator
MSSDSPYFDKPGVALLIIEDPDDQAVVDEGFRSRGWQVRIEHNLSASLDLLVDNWPKMVVTDDLELVELLARAFAIETPDGQSKEGPPVTFIAADDADSVAAYDAGADVVVQHPVDVTAFFAYALS